MGIVLSRLFSIEELKALDLKDIEILKASIANVLRTDDEIQRILETRMREVYARLRERR
jgi:hypothetical protein